MISPVWTSTHVDWPFPGPLTSRSHGVFRQGPPVAQIVMRQTPPLPASNHHSLTR